MPGTVEVVLVPAVSDREPVDGPLPAARVREYYSDVARDRIQQVLDERKPVATTVLVTWVRCKTVHVKAAIVAYREEDAAALKQRVLKRLYRTISPLSPTWRFGQALRASHVYDIILSEPGVNYVGDVRLVVDDVPDAQVASLAPDAFQQNTWYAASGEALFRIAQRRRRLGGDQPVSRRQCAQGQRAPGQTRPGGRRHAARGAGRALRLPRVVRLRRDVTLAVQTGFRIEDLAWMTRDSSPVVLMATSVGLYEFTPDSNAMPVQVLVDPSDANRGFTAVAVATDVRGGGSVSVASYGGKGIYLSTELGQSNTFANIGLAEGDVRVLAVPARSDRERSSGRRSPRAPGTRAPALRWSSSWARRCRPRAGGAIRRAGAMRPGTPAAAGRSGFAA